MKYYTESKKQSSIEWLISQLQKSKDWQRVLNEVSQMSTARIDIIGQAKEMNRSEIEDAYDRKVINEKQNWFIRSGKHYYDLHYTGKQNN